MCGLVLLRHAQGFNWSGLQEQTAAGVRRQIMLKHFLHALLCAANQNAVVVQSPKSGVTFWSYGDYEHQFEAARQRALPVLLALLDTEGEGNSSAGANNGANNAVPAGTAGSSSLTAAGRQAASAAGSNSI